MLKVSIAGRLWPVVLLLLLATSLWPQEKKESRDSEIAKPSGSVRGLMQAHPGGPLEDVEVEVYAAPVDLPSVEAKNAHLRDDDLVLGVVISDVAMAYPIRFLAQYEVVDDHVGKTPVAPTW